MANIITRDTGPTAVNRPLTNAEVDNNFININTELGTKLNSSEKGVANGVAPLDANSKLPPANLPNIRTINGQSLIGSGDVVAEPPITAGTATQYWRGDKSWRDFFADVRAATLTGLSTATSAVITATDTVLQALGKLQAQVTGKQDTLVSGTNIKTVNGNSLLGSGDVAVGDVTLSGTQTLTNKTITGLLETRVAIPASDINLANGNYFTRTISSTTTFTVSNVPASGKAATFILELTNGGSAIVNWFSGVKWAIGTAPTLTASGVDILGFYTHDGGATWRGMLLAKDSK